MGVGSELPELPRVRDTAAKTRQEKPSTQMCFCDQFRAIHDSNPFNSFSKLTAAVPVVNRLRGRRNTFASVSSAESALEVDEFFPRGVAFSSPTKAYPALCLPEAPMLPRAITLQGNADEPPTAASCHRKWHKAHNLTDYTNGHTVLQGQFRSTRRAFRCALSFSG